MIALDGLLWMLAVWFALGRPSDARLRPPGVADSRKRASPWGTRRARYLVSGVAGGAALLILGTPLGPLAAVGALTLLPRWLARLEPAARRRRRDQLRHQAPAIADLLAATLASGAGLRQSLGAVSAAVGEPGRSALRPVVLALDLGALAADAWALVDDDGALEAISVSVARAERSGAALAEVLAAVGDDIRRDQRRAIDVAARTAGVRAVAPLAACFLPAFLLLGVVPVVVALASSVIGAGPGS